jgi:pyruvate,water dikinase
MNIVWFNEQTIPDIVGRKGHHLSRMSQAGLPVPPGFCVTSAGLENPGTQELERALSNLRAGAFAVRSSAVAEDGAAASFAGIYPTLLNVITPEGVRDALREIRQSTWAPDSTAYSRRRNVAEYPRLAAVVQTFVKADAAGVLFMRDPIDGSRRIIVEGAWGLGEAVVGGLIKPDRWILSPEGHVVSSNIADKDIAVVPNESGGTKQTKVEPTRRRRPCLRIESLQELVHLALECERLFGSAQDIEWAITLDRLWLLQSRPITFA